MTVRRTINVFVSFVIDERARMVAAYPSPQRTCLCPCPPGTIYERVWTDAEEKNDPSIRANSLKEAYEAIRRLEDSE